jgi:outer membrane autotransporter protein
MSYRMQRPKLKASTLALSAALTAMTPLIAFAGEPCNDTPIDTSRTGTVQWNSGDCSITSAGSIITTTQNTGLAAVGSNGSGTLTNSGTISAVQYGISNTGTIGTVINDTIGSIAGGGAGISNSVSVGSSGTIGAAATISALTNNGTITATTNNGNNGIGIDNESSTITALTNNGAISSQGKGILNAAIGTGGTTNAPTFGPDSSIGTLTNNGLISSTSDIAIVNSRGTIGTLINNGTISGGGFSAISNDNGGVINTFINSGSIGTIHTAISNSGTIGTLTNTSTGTISGTSNGINNFGTISALANSGTISGAGSGIWNIGGTISALTNSGTISGGNNGIWSDGMIGALTNTITGTIGGTITGNTGINNVGGNIGMLTNNGAITGLTAGIVNTVNGGGSSSPLVVGTIGILTNSGIISGSNSGINNSAMIGTLTNSGIISDTGGNSGNGIVNNGSGVIVELDNQANGTIKGDYAGINNNGGLITTLNNQMGAMISSPNFAILNNGGAITTLNNSGAIVTTGTAGQYAIFNAAGTIGMLSNSGTISGGVAGIYNTASIGTLNNDTVDGSTGLIIGGQFGITNIGGNIDMLTNNGMISSQGVGVANTTGSNIAGTIGTLINNGTISSTQVGIDNESSTITALTNNGAIESSTNIGIENNSGTIVTLTNNGAISGGGFYALSNDSGFIGALTNTGTISSVHTAINNNGTIGTLTNSGNISGVATAIYNPGYIGVLDNASGGTIGATNSAAIYNTGTISTLTNSGLISGVYAIRNTSSGTIGAITNSGVIAGTIRNASVRDLNISGGTGEVFGTLTGSSSGIGIGADNIGTITNTISNVNFSAGNQLLNDNINVTGHSVINSGSVLQVNNTIAVTGNYTQNAAATLQIGVADGAFANGVVSTDSGYGRLVVSGSATFDTGSSVTLQKLPTDNSYAFAQGQRYVVVQATNANAHYNDGSLNYSAIGYNGAVTGASVVDSDNSAKTDLVLTVGAMNTPPPSDPSGPSAPSGPSDPTSPSAPINSATDSNAASSLTGLFNYTGTNAGMLNLFNAAAATGGTGEANRAGAQLSPASTGTALVQSTQASSQAVLDVTSAHIDAIRVAQASGTGDDSNSGIATGERPGDVAVWGQAFGGQANQNDRAGASGYRADYNGMLIGADTALNDQWRAGGLFSYANTSIANSGDNAGSSGHVSSYGLTGYAGYAAEKWYLNLFAGAAQQKYSTFRNVSFSGFNGGASGSFDGMQYVASAQAGYPIKLDATTTVTPIAGVTYSRLRQDGYTETGSAAALQIGSASTSSIKSDLGAKLERSFKTAYGDMIPSAQLSWRHEYRNTGLQSVGNFAADTTGTTSFTTQGAELEKDTGVLVLGVTLARSQNLTVAAHYSLEAAGGYNAQTADVRLRYQF